MGETETSIICLGNVEDRYTLNAVPRNCFVIEIFFFLFCLLNLNRVYLVLVRQNTEYLFLSCVGSHHWVCSATGAQHSVLAA